MVDAPPAIATSSAGRLARQLKRLADPAGHEVEDRAALHGQRFALVVGEHEDRCVIRGSSPHQPRQLPEGAPRSGLNMFRPMM